MPKYGHAGSTRSGDGVSHLDDATESDAGAAAVDLDDGRLAGYAVIDEERLALVPREGAALERHLVQGNIDALGRVYACVSSFAGHKEILAPRRGARRADAIRRSSAL